MSAHLETADREYHASAGELIMLLDGEPISAHAIEHLKSCATCEARRDQLSARSSAFGELLRTTDVEVVPMQFATLAVRTKDAPLSQAKRRRIRAAAFGTAVFVLGVTAAAASPVRGWIAQNVRALFGNSESTARRTPREQPVAVPPSPPTPGSTIAFTTTHPELIIRLDARQPTGRISLAYTSESQSTAQFVGTTTREEFLVLDGELRIRNFSTSEADYRIVVSSRVTQVRLVVGQGALSAPIHVSPSLAYERSVQALR